MRNAKPLQGRLMVTIVSGSRRALRSDTLSGLLRFVRQRACSGAFLAQGRAQPKTRRNDAREALTRERARQWKMERR
ncbi:hypothetical protein GCT13_06220 [Paraburkholderia sp. CNPSo 3157]|uniref:Uncharacterized protein n=1 Tax=Paraburkholderia franconis TaxID=2654983 RepID=A0A7X1N722_9BURK|nr:hypothetical protein [Paraburkholderia franconis]MPW16539.1 hypothetical protein [Paraburkholderia franconis]